MKIGFWSLVKADKRVSDAMHDSIRTDSYVKWFIGIDDEDFDELFTVGQIIDDWRLI